MNKVSITTAKNQFGRLMEQVKLGEVIFITKWSKPVALLRPVEVSDQTNELLTLPKAKLDLAAFLIAPRGAIHCGHALSHAIIEERNSS
jgi:prevent-host-death family protein